MIAACLKSITPAKAAQGFMPYVTFGYVECLNTPFGITDMQPQNLAA